MKKKSVPYATLIILSFVAVAANSAFIAFVCSLSNFDLYATSYGEVLFLASNLLVWCVSLKMLGNKFSPYCKFCKATPCQETPCPKCGRFAKSSHALKAGMPPCSCLDQEKVP